jgi:hypothetical protein
MLRIEVTTNQYPWGLFTGLPFESNLGVPGCGFSVCAGPAARETAAKVKIYPGQFVGRNGELTTIFIR